MTTQITVHAVTPSAILRFTAERSAQEVTELFKGNVSVSSALVQEVIEGMASQMSMPVILDVIVTIRPKESV